MKKTITLIAMVIGFTVAAQNTFPSSGNVGVGTTTPTEELEVEGTTKAVKGIFTGSEIENETFANYNEGIDKSIVFSAGKLIPGSSDRRVFTMHDMSMGLPYDFNSVLFNMRDRAGKERFNISLTEGFGSDSSFELKDHNQGEIIKVKGNSGGAYVQIPKANTKFIIGGYSNNAIIGNHNFVVLGSSLIDGNILTNGNIGIGTENFGSWKLAVNGKIRAKEVKVETGWSDFVFEDAYDLPTLEEVEEHIKTEGHLKDIPSAKEVEENGILLGEMDSKLLQKIEELTLYMIELNKKVKVLEEENKKLKAQLNK